MVGTPAVEGGIPPPAHGVTGGPTHPGFCCFLPLLLTTCKSLKREEKKKLCRGGGSSTQPRFVHQLIKKDIKSMLSPKILIEVFK